QEIAILQAIRRVAYRVGSGRVECGYELADRQCREEMRAVNRALFARCRVAGDAFSHAHARRVADRYDLLSQRHGLASVLEDIVYTVPHLAGTETRVAELIDERHDDGAAVLALALGQQRVLDGLGQVKPLDALGG